MKNTRIRWGIVAAIAIILIVLAFAWFWSLGEAQAGSPPSIRIESVKQPVEWHHANEIAWLTLNDATVAQAGDTIRTGEGGEARIVWGDRGTTRLDAGSEITLETIPEDGSLNPGAKIKIKLESGRIWSRVIKLLDLGSSMQVESSAVVATVRGTSFGAAKVAGGAEFAVTESVVDVVGSSGTRTLLRDNQWGDFDQSGSPKNVRELLSSDTWATLNREADKREERDELSTWRKRLEDRASSLKNAPAFLLDASESFHLALANGDRKQTLASAYAERRLARISTENRPQDVARFRTYITLTGDARSRLLGDWHGLAALRGRTGQGDVAVARTWRTELAPASVPNRAYLNAVAIDDRIDDFLAAPGARDQTILEKLRADIDTFETSIDPLVADQTEKSGLHRKAEALRIRIEGVREIPIVEAPPIPVPDVPPPAGIQIPDPVKRPPALLKPVLTAPVTAPVITKPVGYQRYQLLASPSSIVIGQSVKLSMFGITATGQADDLTSRTSFSAAANSGTMSGNIFTPSVAGTISISGSVDGKIASASITVTKTAPVVGTALKGLAFQFTGPTVMGCSAYTAFKVIASYTDGKTADVTMLSKLSVTDPKLIYVGTGSVMSFCTVDVAKANVIASYTENQVTKSASEVITVTKDPGALTAPSGCIGRYCW
ncbi:MAG: FecR family protein [Candidatus Uhrbacteria bacterium]